MSEPLRFAYSFRFSDGTEKTFEVQLDAETLGLEAPTRAEYPEWTALRYKQCPNCPLSPETHPRCPIAERVVDLVEFFRESISHEEAEVVVEAQTRTYTKLTSLQKGISSLLGIYMVTTGCPVMNKLRPMVETHLPFMSPTESTYRMIAMYLLAQLILSRHGEKPDWELLQFVEFLREVRTTNTGFWERLRSLGMKDASLNALNSLNSMGEITRDSLEENDLGRWERIFLAHFAKK